MRSVQYHNQSFASFPQLLCETLALLSHIGHQILAPHQLWKKLTIICRHTILEHWSVGESEGSRDTSLELLQKLLSSSIVSHSVPETFTATWYCDYCAIGKKDPKSLICPGLTPGVPPCSETQWAIKKGSSWKNSNNVAPRTSDFWLNVICYQPALVWSSTGMEQAEREYKSDEMWTAWFYQYVQKTLLKFRKH